MTQIQTRPQTRSPSRPLGAVVARALPQPRAFLALMAGTLAVLAALALPGRAATREEAQDFLRVTGFDVALDGIALSAEDGPAMLGIDDPGFQGLWNVMAKKVFTSDEMQNIALSMLQETLTEDEMTVARDFYGSDLGQRLVKVEDMSHMDTDPDRGDKAKAVLNELLEQKDVDRVAALERLVTALDDTGDGAKAMAEVQSRFMIAARNAGVIELRVGDDELRDMIAKQFRDLQDSDGTQRAVANAAFTYKDFTVEEIEAYADALEAPGMQKVYELMNAVQYEVMANRFEAAAGLLSGAQIGEEL